jgi:hypothetical protein
MGGENISTDRDPGSVRLSTMALLVVLALVTIIYFFYLPQ